MHPGEGRAWAFHADPKKDPSAQFISEIEVNELLARDLDDLPVERTMLTALARADSVREVYIVNGLERGNWGPWLVARNPARASIERDDGTERAVRAGQAGRRAPTAGAGAKATGQPFLPLHDQCSALAQASATWWRAGHDPLECRARDTHACRASS